VCEVPSKKFQVDQTGNDKTSGKKEDAVLCRMVPTNSHSTGQCIVVLEVQVIFVINNNDNIYLVLVAIGKEITGLVQLLGEIMKRKKNLPKKNEKKILKLYKTNLQVG